MREINTEKAFNEIFDHAWAKYYPYATGQGPAPSEIELKVVADGPAIQQMLGWAEEEQERQIKLSYEKLLKALQSYAAFDLQASEREYVLGVLQDECGLTDDEIRAAGMDYLLDE